MTCDQIGLRLGDRFQPRIDARVPVVLRGEGEGWGDHQARRRREHQSGRPGPTARTWSRHRHLVSSRMRTVNLSSVSVASQPPGAPATLEKEPSGGRRRVNGVMTDFDQFVAAHVDDLLRTAYLIVWDEGEAEDLVQECLLKVARRWPRIRRMEQPRAYARRILVNLALDGARGRARRRSELEPASAGKHPRGRPAAGARGACRTARSAWRVARAPTGGARPALLQRLDRGAGRRGSRLFAGDGQEQRLARTRAAARGAAASSTPPRSIET